MLQRKAPAETILPDVPARARAFAYRPYRTSFVGEEGSTVCADESDGDGSDGSDSKPAAKIVWRAPTAENDRLQLGRMHASAAHARIREARRLVDDARFEYACDALYECQRGFNFLGRANFSPKL
ncbi:hypothetical protein LPJ61_002879 [Coemansia biformis]|uniref:Uncharacterized protein n=1 Tax=Coemansia biformis TaxID=1286918 RepID=A0A9W8CWS7_9FUNG|nr:hypothetical protein LPJ61_002879 [Coemansia biformis]